jgi:hypothetical protein
MAGVEAPLMVAWQACGRDEREGRRRGAAGGAAWLEGQQGGRHGGEGHGGAAGLPLRALCFASYSREGCCAWLSVVRERGRKQEEGEEEKKRKRRKRKEKKEKIMAWKFSEK